MKRLKIAVLILVGAMLGLAVVWAGNLEPPGPPASTMVTLAEINAKLNTLIDPNHKFVGVTTATTQGGVGWKTLNDMCQTEFGSAHPDIKMCSSEEILRTPTRVWPSLTGGPPEGFWVQPTFRLSFSRDQNTSASDYVLDISGAFHSPDNLACRSWTASSGNGLTLTSSGAFGDSSCSVPKGVTCCAP